MKTSREHLISLIIEQLEQTKDVDMLDLVYKLLLTES